MRKTYILLIIIFALACTEKDNSNGYHQLLQGDWVSSPTIEGSLYGPRVIFSVEDSLLTFGPYSDYVKYNVLNDSLLVEKKIGFKIFSLTRDSLTIAAYYEDKRRNDTFQLTRVNKKNSLVPVKIFYSSSGCFGECPSMILEIDSSGRFFFWGRSHTSNKGAHSGKLTSRQYQMVLESIRQLPLDSLKNSYEADWSDDQSASVVILTVDKRIASSAYGFDKEPVELRILFHKLSEVYKTVPLRVDTTLTMEYFFQYNAPQIPVPLQIEPPPVKRSG